MYDIIVVGSGVAGATAARTLAEKGKKVLVVEKRDHIGGNCYDVNDEYGVLIHKYGPHIFHTSDEKVYEFLSRFTDWYMFGHEVVAKVHDKLIPVPFNLNTLHMVYDDEKADRLEKKLIETFGEGARVPILKLREQCDADMAEIADYVYKNVFLYYTMKQWGQKPEDINPEVTGRVPVVISRDNRYFGDKYQGMPKDGYTPMFEKMLSHENIEVRVGTDIKDIAAFDNGKVVVEGKEFDGEIIYTGAIDELFDYKYDRLPYRTLDFDFEHLDADSFQGRSVVNYTVDEDFTRITEFKYLTGQKDAKGTTIVREYSKAYSGKDGEIPYYAIINDENMAQYKKYEDEAGKFKNLHLLGRLAEYKYYNIDAIAAKALEMAEKLA